MLAHSGNWKMWCGWGWGGPCLGLLPLVLCFPGTLSFLSSFPAVCWESHPYYWQGPNLTWRTYQDLKRSTWKIITTSDSRQWWCSASNCRSFKEGKERIQENRELQAVNWGRVLHSHMAFQISKMNQHDKRIRKRKLNKNKIILSLAFCIPISIFNGRPLISGLMGLWVVTPMFYFLLDKSEHDLNRVHADGSPLLWLWS